MAVYNTTPHHTTNFFSPQDNFFIIDSENLSSVTSKFYGFSIQKSGIYDRHNITQEALARLDGNGTYVSIERAGDEIVIRQDFNGCYGLYVYQAEGRFVFSNSFFHLMDYMSKRTRLTLNRDYANHYLIMGCWSMAYSETFISEITLLPRNAIVRINIPSGTFSTERINYGENTVRLNSSEGIRILDEWFTKWTGIFRNLYELTPNIEVDLSGGFDSRISFMLLVNSGIDLSKICMHSVIGKGYTYEEDYKVATEIGRHFGFTLNNTDNFKGGELNYSVEDVINAAFYTRMFGHIQLDQRTTVCEEKHFRVTGFQGEVIREYLHPSNSLFMADARGGACFFSSELRKELGDSIERIMTHLLDEISKNVGSPLSDDFSPHVLRETCARYHFGAFEASRVACNVYILPPIADTGLNRLRLNDEECPDRNLLMSVIFTRYCPELLRLPFVKGRVINPDTIKFAEKINASFPRTDSPAKVRDFSFVSRDPAVSALLERNNPPLEPDAHSKFIRSVYDSTATRKLFATYFDEEIYVYADEYAKRVIHYPLAKCLSITTTAEVIKHIIISEGTQEHSLAEDFREFAETGRTSCSDKRADKALRKGLALRRIASIPDRAIRKIMRIISHK